MHINELHVRILHYFKVVGKQLSGRNQLTRKKKELGNKLLSIVQRKKKTGRCRTSRNYQEDTRTFSKTPSIYKMISTLARTLVFSPVENEQAFNQTERIRK